MKILIKKIIGNKFKLSMLKMGIKKKSWKWPEMWLIIFEILVAIFCWIQGSRCKPHFSWIKFEIYSNINIHAQIGRGDRGKREEERDQNSKMCYESKCSNCGKTSWGGCGRHVPAVHKRIPEGQHCNCKAWPGVDSAVAADSGASCTILWSDESLFFFFSFSFYK